MYGTQNIKTHNRTTQKKTKKMSNTELRTYRYITGQHEKQLRNEQQGTKKIKIQNRTTRKKQKK
jgi:hypothetical protein